MPLETFCKVRLPLSGRDLLMATQILIFSRDSSSKATARIWLGLSSVAARKARVVTTSCSFPRGRTLASVLVLASRLVMATVGLLLSGSWTTPPGYRRARSAISSAHITSVVAMMA